MKNGIATIKTETLTDGSVVYNVVRDGEEIASPPSLEFAQALCAKLNSSEPLAALERIARTDHTSFGDLERFAVWVRTFAQAEANKAKGQ